jgi:hypothetical protein
MSERTRTHREACGREGGGVMPEKRYWLPSGGWTVSKEYAEKEVRERRRWYWPSSPPPSHLPYQPEEVGPLLDLWLVGKVAVPFLLFWLLLVALGLV